MEETNFDPFVELLEVMDPEHLIRFRRRLEKKGKTRLVRILTEEIKRREELWTGEEFPTRS